MAHTVRLSVGAAEAAVRDGRLVSRVALLDVLAKGQRDGLLSRVLEDQRLFN